MFTCWPPAPEERNTCISMSAGFSWTSASSISGSTATVAVEVWTRPPRLGLRHPLDPVDAALKLQPGVGPLPLHCKGDLLYAAQLRLAERCPPRPSSPGCSAYMEYIRYREWANRAASSPPTPARISTMTFFVVVGVLGQQEDLQLLLQPRDLLLGLLILLLGQLLASPGRPSAPGPRSLASPARR